MKDGLVHQDKSGIIQT